MLNGRQPRGITFTDFIAITLAAFSGVALTTVSYPGPGPLLFAVLLFLIGAAIVRLSGGGREERRAFCLSFAICLLAVGVARLSIQSHGIQATDSAHFYRAATSDNSGLSFSDMVLQSEGSGAIIVWGALYRFAEKIGFEAELYLGVYLNTLLVAFSGALSVRIARIVFGDDTRRLRLVANLFALSGLCWLFAAIHVRDSFALLLSTLLLFTCVQLVALPNLGRLIVVGISLAVLAPLMWVVRQESILLILLFPLFAVLASFLGFNRSRVRLLISGLVLMGVVLAMARFQTVPNDFSRIDRTRKAYTGSAIATNSTSLGTKYLLSAPLPIRTVCGSIYLLLFPIPFWSGFQFASAYHLFKSCQAILFLLVAPAFGLGLIKAIGKRDFAPLSIVVLVAAFAFAGVAVTSMETRHVGQFLPAILIVAAFPDLGDRRDKSNHRMLAGAWITGLTILYAAWALAKFGM